ASRTDDIVGIAFAYGRISPAAAATDRALAAITGVPIPIRDYEAAIELTYRLKLAEDWSIQPDLQYIFHPGANIANPANPASVSAIPHALGLRLRTALSFECARALRRFLSFRIAAPAASPESIAP